MIPQRIYLKGVLCYRGEQELYFTDSPIWMLSGPNGSGKSAVFDAVTFALYGYHRGGKTNPRDLINKDEPGLAVEFDFLLDGELFRLRRTARKRGGATRQVSHWVVTGEQGGTWEVVADTETDRGFDEWVRHNVGLTYESFTSSVLLLQGQAERVLSPRPSDRREILESVVDLNRYQRLHERIEEKRKGFKIRAETLAKQLQAIPKIRDSDLIAVQTELRDRELANQQALQDTERLQTLRNHADERSRLETDLAAHRISFQQAQELVANADSIRTDWNRLQELRELLPRLKYAFEQRQRLAAVENRLTCLLDEERRFASQIAEHELLIAESRQRQQSITAQITTYEERLQVVETQLRGLSEFLGRSRACDQLRGELAELERQLSVLPQDAAEIFNQLQWQREELLATCRSISPLTRLSLARNAVRYVTGQLKDTVETERELRENVSVLTTEWGATCTRLESITSDRQQVDRKVTQTRALRDQAARRVADFAHVAGQTTCSLCGQLLTAAHIEAEQTRLVANLTALETDLSSANDLLTSFEGEEQASLQIKTTIEARLTELHKQLNESQPTFRTYERELRQHVDACKSIYDVELDTLSRERVAREQPADWLSTTYPTQADLDEIQQKAARLSDVEIELQIAINTFETFKNLQERARCIRDSIALQQTGFSDPTALRRDNEQFVNEELNVKRLLAECRQQLAAEVSAADVLSTQYSQSQQDLASARAEIKVSSEHCRQVRRSLSECSDSLPSNWQTSFNGLSEQDLQNLADELKLLMRQGLETRYNALLRAEANVDSIGKTVAQLECRCNELPVGACQAVNEIDRLIAMAKSHQSASDKGLQEVRLEADRLTQRRNQRQQLRADYQSASQEHGHYETLAELLGPRKLQRELVRRAESEIVDLANSMLDRVSGGQLELTLASREERDGDCLGKNVLQLEACNRKTASEPLGVAFLSGSQRFRVAVSLALGMGQYASARRRSIQSVIIDEGFGSLDREGRQVMIQELQNLRGHLERIVLVSHQEEFADAFPDGYRFELIDGATQVARFHR